MAHVAVGAGTIVSCSAAMMEVVALARRLAPHPLPIALVGETGVGKRLLARFVHDNSGRAGPFVAVDGAEIAAAAQPLLTGDEPRPLGRNLARLRAAFEGTQNGTLLLED